MLTLGATHFAAAPCATCNVVSTISAGPIANLVCQVPGPAVTVSGFGTSTVYDLVKTSQGVLGYVSDLAVLQTPYARFDSRLPRCDAAGGQVNTAATKSGYGWVASCAVKVATGDRWACWKAGLK